jgi:hypothetical protein
MSSYKSRRCIGIFKNSKKHNNSSSARVGFATPPETFMQRKFHKLGDLKLPERPVGITNADRAKENQN